MGFQSAEHYRRYPSAVTIKSAICEYSTMAYNHAASDREAGVAAALANSMHRKRCGERVNEMSISAIGIINVLMLAGVAIDSFPYRWVLAVQIGLPWVSFALTWYFVDREQDWGGRYISLLFSTFLTSLMALIPYGYMSLVSSTRTVLWACAVGLAIFLALTVRELADWKINRWIAIMVAGSLMFYSYVALLQLNCVLDQSPALVYTSTVAGKVLVFRGPDRLRIQPWSAFHGIATVGVSPRVYNSVQRGDTICVVQRTGAFNTIWFTAQTCPWTGGPVDLGPVGRMSSILRRLTGS